MKVIARAVAGSRGKLRPREEIQPVIPDDVATIYQGPLDGFIARRTALAKQLRSSDADAAAAVGKLRKPSVSAWAIDQLAVESPDLLAELLAAGADAGRAQRAVAEGVGSGEALSVASARVRDALDAAVRAATTVLDSNGHATGEEAARRIRTTLQAAASGSPDERAALWRGTLDRDLAPAGFGAPEGLDDDIPELAAVLAPLRREPSAQQGRPPADRSRQARDVAAQRAAETEAAEKSKSAARAREMADTKRQHADRLAGEAKRAEEDAAAAEAAAQTAEHASESAQAALAQHNS
jgi:hypothetical protein